jgi:hypothetical protein
MKSKYQDYSDMDWGNQNSALLALLPDVKDLVNEMKKQKKHKLWQCCFQSSSTSRFEPVVPPVFLNNLPIRS